MPPAFATRPSMRAIVTPMMESRGAPWPWRRGPLSLVATTPPMVARSGHGGSHGRRWPCAPSAAFTAASVAPASAVAVRSPCRCSTTAESAAVESSRSTAAPGVPQSCLVPPPETRTDSPSADAQASVAASASPLAGAARRRGRTPSTASSSAAARAAAPGPARAVSRSTSAAAVADAIRRAPRGRPPPPGAGGTVRGPRRTAAASETPSPDCRCSRDRRRSARAASCRGRPR